MFFNQLNYIPTKMILTSAMLFLMDRQLALLGNLNENESAYRLAHSQHSMGDRRGNEGNIATVEA